VRRFELTVIAFLVFNTALALLVLREQRSLLRYCIDHGGPQGDCVEPYNSLWVAALGLIWLVGAVVLGGIALAGYLPLRRRLQEEGPSSPNLT
jgi:multisubunit Na+/H+ antiporter MnhB subunit